MGRDRGFTLLEAAVVLLAIAAVFATVAIYQAGRSRRTGGRPQMPHLHLRGIHQSMVLYAQGNGGHFPGLHPDGTDAGLTVENRFQILLDGNYFGGDYLINPAESKVEWTTGALTPAQYSYALLQVPRQGGRHAEWHESLNSDAPVAADRNTGTAARPQSIDSGSGPWRGEVVYNDNHVEFETTSVLPTAYGGAPPVAQDDLFTAQGDDDALLLHHGN